MWIRTGFASMDTPGKAKPAEQSDPISGTRMFQKAAFSEGSGSAVQPADNVACLPLF